MNSGSGVRRPHGLLDRLHAELRTRHYSPRTEEAYVGWIRRFVRYHEMRHPAQIGAKGISEFLTQLATVDRVSASTQNQALSAILFFYAHVLGQRPEELGEFVRAKRPVRLPVVLSAK